MKKIKSFSKLPLITTIALITSCATSKNLDFAVGEWSVDTKNNCVVNADSTYVFPISGKCDSSMIVIANNTDIADFNKLDVYLYDIKQNTMLERAKVLVYLPENNTMWLELPKDYVYNKPKSVTSNLYEERPYTMWVRTDDIETWDRSENDMYTYTYHNGRRKWLCVVDIFNYGTKAIARVYILQTNTNWFSRIGLPSDSSFPFNTTSIETIEMLSNWVDGHRLISIENYKKGYNLKKGK